MASIMDTYVLFPGRYHHVFVLQEALEDENRRVSDVKPFQRMLKVEEKKGDRTEQALNSQIGFLIGKGMYFVLVIFRYVFLPVP